MRSTALRLVTQHDNTFVFDVDSGEITEFHVADSVTATEPGVARRLALLKGRLGFVVANPPASSGDDGFGFRRRVLADVAPLVAAGGVVLLNVSAQYGMGRVSGLVGESGDAFRYAGLLESTGTVPFDLGRPDLRSNVQDYVAEEQRGLITGQ